MHKESSVVKWIAGEKEDYTRRKIPLKDSKFIIVKHFKQLLQIMYIIQHRNCSIHIYGRSDNERRSTSKIPIAF